MDPKYGEFVGVDSLHVANVTTDDDASYAAETPTYLAPTAEISQSPEVANKTTYYDNKAANNYVTEGKTEVKITVSGIPASDLAKLLGKSYDTTNGRIYDTGQANPPEVALGFRYNMGSDGYRYYWYFKGTFSGGEEVASTKTNDIDVKTYQLTYTAFTTNHEWTIDGELQSLKRVFGDTSDSNFSGTDWFSSVQQPVEV